MTTGQITAAVLAGFVVLLLAGTVLARPLRLTLRLLLHTLLGLAALLLCNLLTPLTGLHLGFNLANALVVGVLGAPGLLLLLLLSWVW